MPVLALLAACDSDLSEPNDSTTGAEIEAGVGAQVQPELREIEIPSLGQNLIYQVVHGNALVEGDINMGPVEDFEQWLQEADLSDESAPSMAADADDSFRAAGLANASVGYLDWAIWPGSVIPFEFDDSWSGISTQAVRDGIRHFEERTNLRFVEVTSGDRVVFTRHKNATTGCAANICSSGIGYVPGAGEHYVCLPDGCHNFPTTVHEVGHRIGLGHEHSRGDRDIFINIDPNSNVSGNCAIWPNLSEYLTDYDLNSVMHYGTTNCGFIQNKADPSLPTGSWGLSDRDVTGIQVLYGNQFQPTISAVAPRQERLDMFVKDFLGHVWQKSYIDGHWGGYQYHTGRVAGAPEAVSWGPDRIDLFVRDLFGNRELSHKWWDGTNWRSSAGLNQFENLGGVISSHPTVVSSKPGRFDIFVKGGATAPNDHGIWHKSYDEDDGWSPSMTGWTELGGVANGALEAVSMAPNRVDLFVVGDNLRLYHKALIGDSQWVPSRLGWTDLGGRIHGKPSVTSSGLGAIEIVVKDHLDRMYHKRYVNGQWEPSRLGWDDLGENISGTPEVVSSRTGDYDVYFRGVNGDLRHKWNRNDQWFPSDHESESLGGLLHGAPSPVSWGNGHQTIFVRDFQDQVYHKTFNVNRWWPSDQGWYPAHGLLAW